MKRLDIYLIIAVVAITSFLFIQFTLQSGDNQEVIISVKGEEYGRFKLDGKHTVLDIETELGYNKVILDDNGVRIEEADCPDHDCVEIGFIHRSGQSIICAPHQLVIEIVGSSDADLDGISI